MTVPVHKAGKKNGRQCYQWGKQKRYCGKGAKAKARRQGRAIRASQKRRSS